MKTRIIETTRTLFGIMGACGYAGYLASMRPFWCILSLSMLSCAWYGVYWTLYLRGGQ